MRALTAVSAVLVIMAVLLAELSAPDIGAHTQPPEEARRLAAERASVQPAPTAGSEALPAVGSQSATGAARAAAAVAATQALGPERTMEDEAQRAAEATTQLPSAPRIERFRRGSREHAAAVGKVLASPDYSQVVAPVARLYLAYFNRVPDYEGFGHYNSEREVGVPLADIAQEFAGSAEFDMRYGALDNAAFVDRVYRNVGAGDAAHRDYWIAQLDSGAMTRGQVMLQFSESDRFRAATHDAVFIAMAYAEALRRAPTPAERAHWEAFLVAGHPHGAMLEALVAGEAEQ